MDNITIRFSLQDDLSSGLKQMTIPADDLKNAIAGVTDAAENAKTVFGKMTDSLISIKTIADSVSGVVSSFAEAAAPAIDFQQKMADLSAITGIVGSDLEEVAETARRIGSESGLGASEAARAFALLAGQLDAPVEDIGLILEKSATLAQAAGLSIDDAANSLAATISQYGMAASDADRIMNVLAAGSRVGASEVVDLAQSFKVVGAAASSLGVDVEHTAGALEVLGGANIKGAEAGTALRNVLLSLKTKLGVDTSVTDLSDALAALRPQLQDTEFLAKTFGVANVTAATYLIQNADAVREMTDAVTDTQAAQEQAEIRNATWAHSVEVMRAKIDDVKISVGSALGDFGALSQVLVENASTVTSTVEMISLASTGIRNFGTWLKSTTLATRVATVASRAWNATTAFGRNLMTATIARLNVWRAAIAKTVVWQKIAAVATKAWAAAQAAFNFIASLNPIGLLIAGITLLVGAIAACIYWFDSWGETVLMCMGPVGSLIASIVRHWDSLKRAFTDGGFIAGLHRIGEVLMDVVLAPMQKLLSWVAELTGWDWAKAASQWVHDVRVDHNLTEGETETEKKEDEGKKEKETNPLEAALESAPSSASGTTTSLGIGAATAATPSVATAQSGGQIKRVDINIDSVVREFTVSTSNLQQSASDIRDLVARALLDAVNDVNYAI